MLQLQAHRGVCTEYPENTMAAYRGAIRQEYDIIELDPAVTVDGVFVVLHDSTINRTARKKDGSPIQERKYISEMTYEEADQYDYGLWFSHKFRGERLPLLKDVLDLAKESGVSLKIDNKIWRFPEERLVKFWELLRESGVTPGITCYDLNAVRRTRRELPEAEIHYDGRVNEETLQKLAALGGELTVWIPSKTKATSWAKVDFATEERCRMIKKYGKLGIWIVNNYEDYDEIKQRFQPDVVETPGQIKPVRNRGHLVDCHTHSEQSHDSACPVSDMAVWQQKKGCYGFAVTDHCDILRGEEVLETIRGSVKSAETEAKKSAVRIFKGVEIGESLKNLPLAEEVLGMCDYDVVVASVHVLECNGKKMTNATTDFGAIGMENVYRYLNQYYDDVLETLQTISCDIAAHLNISFRYINGKYGLGVDCRVFEEKIRVILQYMIDHGIALEINTSGMKAEGEDLMEQNWLLGIYREMGGLLVTLGSDAHVCENAGKEFGQAVALLKKHGFPNCFYYENRQSVQCALE